MIEIDGSKGEGGGQIVRSAVALSMVTGTPIRVRNIRARRRRPGLRQQHLTAVRAAAEICRGRLTGAEVGATTIELAPGPITAGNYHFAVGTAGSTTLVLQTILPALVTADGPSTLTLEGGTHNPMAPPFPFLASTFLPILEKMGPKVTAVLERPGFFPAGGGRLRVDIDPCARLGRLELLDAGKRLGQRATAIVARLPRHIGERELEVVQKKMGWPRADLHIDEITQSDSPGNLLVLEVVYETLTETFVGFGKVRLPAENVAAGAVREMRRYLDAGVPVGEYLADQLILPMALAGTGTFATLPLSRHATTQIDLVRQFLDITITVEEREKQAVLRFG